MNKDLNTFKETFSYRLNRLRKQFSLTQPQLAEKSNINVTLISRYENEQRLPTLRNLRSLAKVFEVTPDYLACKSQTLNPRLPKKILLSLSRLSDKDLSLVYDFVLLLRRRQEYPRDSDSMKLNLKRPRKQSEPRGPKGRK